MRLEASQLSGGNQQKLLLAKVMMADPSVNHHRRADARIDIGTRARSMTSSTGMVRAGKACIVISSEMPELVGLADRVAGDACREDRR